MDNVIQPIPIECFFTDAKVIGTKFVADLYAVNKNDNKDIHAVTLVVNVPWFTKILGMVPNKAVPQDSVQMALNPDYEDTIPETEEFRVAWAGLKSIPKGRFRVLKLTFTFNPTRFKKELCEFADKEGKILPVKLIEET